MYEYEADCRNWGDGVGQALLCLQCWLPAAGWGNLCPLSPRRLLRLLAPVLRGTVEFSPLLDLLQHPEVLLVAGES